MKNGPVGSELFLPDSRMEIWTDGQTEGQT
jgi:hypothetical protein